MIKQIAEKDPLNYDYVEKYAVALANAGPDPSGKTGVELAQE